MFAKRYKAEELIDIIAAPSYAPELLKIINKTVKGENLGVYLDSKARLGVTGTIAKDYVKSDVKNAVPYFTTKQVGGNLYATTDGCKYISADADKKWAHCRVPNGTIIINKSGNVGAAAIVNAGQYDYVNSVSDIINIRLKESTQLDAGYLVIYLNSKYGQSQLLRLCGGAIFDHVSLHAIPGIKLPRTGYIAQTYIGNKVRQAEQLREWAKQLDRELKSIFERLIPSHQKKYDKYSIVDTALLTDMLTAETYKQEYIENQRKIVEQYPDSVFITSYFKSIVNGYDEREEIEDGLDYAKVGDIRSNDINLSECPKIGIGHWENATIYQRPGVDDLLLTRKGSFGIAAVVGESQRFLVSSEVFVCKPKNRELMPLLSYFINSYPGQSQFWQFSTGTTMPGMNQQNLAKILVPDLSLFESESFNEKFKILTKTRKLVKALAEVSKKLVEALIEGQIAEAELIAAQQALENDDNSKDRVILSKFTGKGYLAENGKILFPDLDALYDLLDEVTLANNSAEQG